LTWGCGPAGSGGKKPIMKRRSAIFLQAAIVLIGIAVFAFLLWEPHLEGRNAHATLFEIYFKDTFLACAYLASIPFFVALYLAFKLSGRAGRNEAFSPRSLRDLRTIKYCMIAVIGFVAVGEAYLFLVVRGKDDIAGGVAMGILVVFLTAAIATAAAVFERILQIRTSLQRH
jgi:hypothetical protein